MLDDAAFGPATEAEPKQVSPSDPTAQWTGALGGRAFFAYATNDLIDTDHAVIVKVETTRAMIDRAMDRFGLWPEALIADTAYGSAPLLNWLVDEHGIEPHVTVFDKSARCDGTFERSDFTHDCGRRA